MRSVGACPIRVHPRARGETRTTSRFDPTIRVHPRARGETLCSPISTIAVGGASPRARGNQFTLNTAGFTKGCIPARAGKPSYASLVSEPKMVHPRARGETIVISHAVVSVVGASPRARGNPRR